MNRLNKELRNRGILYEADDMMIALRGIEYDNDAVLLTVTDKFLVTVTYYAVIDPVITIYDRFTLEPIAVQDLYKDNMFFEEPVSNPWHVFFLGNENF